MAYFNVLSYLLSRVSFLATHLVFAYWLNFIFNDPLNLKQYAPEYVNTLDATKVLPEGKCTPLSLENLISNVLLFGAWWAQHSIMARTTFKVATGLLHHPLERPLFAVLASVVWFATIYFWRPISDCKRFSIFEINPAFWVVSGPILLFGTLLVVGLLWSLPDHVFGTGRYKFPPGHVPAPSKIIRNFPYGLVRHPAATGFLWMYWAVPSYTPNHVLLAVLWTVFILVGTLVFEEGGLRGPDEFGKAYAEYAKEVSGLYPNSGCIFSVLGGGNSTGNKAKRTHTQ